MSRYQRAKQKAREEAMQWQHDFVNHSYSYSDMADFTSHFEKKAKRYGLIKEFRENGII